MSTRSIEPYVRVRVRQLLRPLADYPWFVGQRVPVVGDVGTVIEVLSAPGAPAAYVVEVSAADGTTVWVAHLAAEELELVEPN